MSELQSCQQCSERSDLLLPEYYRRRFCESGIHELTEENSAAGNLNSDKAVTADGNEIKLNAADPLGDGKCSINTIQVF